jgi:hypothetical protein
MASPPRPLPWLLIQPRPCAGYRPLRDGADERHRRAMGLAKVWPPAISATVSSSFIAMRAKVSRMSRAEPSGSGVPLGPSGFT